MTPLSLYLMRCFFVPGQGFEPQFPDSESGVLPLDDPGLFIFSFCTAHTSKKPPFWQREKRCLFLSSCYNWLMKKRKSLKSDQPATQGQLQSVIDTLHEVADFIIKEIKDFRLQEKFNWEEQRRFNKEISQKVDMNTYSIKALDARVRYQDDMPERLEHVQNQQYRLTLRVKALEDKNKTVR